NQQPLQNTMKTQKKNGQGFYLQTRNNRWKWMAGATAATAAGVTASQASLVTINLTNNYTSGSQGNHLNADLTGDGHPDLTISRAFASYSTYKNGSSAHYIFVHPRAQADLNGLPAAAGVYGDNGAHGV